MDIHQAKSIAIELMQAHGLSDWAFDFDHASRRFGCCYPTLKRITLSWKLTLLNDESQVRHTILHEIAHALTPGQGHGTAWKLKCVELGISAQRCFTADEVKLPTKRASPYEVGCPRCGWWHDRHRLPDRQLRCAKCKKSVIYRARDDGRTFDIVGTGKSARIVYHNKLASR